MVTALSELAGLRRTFTNSRPTGTFPIKQIDYFLIDYISGGIEPLVS